MVAARALNTIFKFRYGLLAAAVSGASVPIFYHRRTSRYDSSVTTKLVQDQTLRRDHHAIPQAKPSSSASPTQPSTQDNAHELESYLPAFEHDDDNAWVEFSRNINHLKETIDSLGWAGIQDKITDLMLPSWATALPGQLQKLQKELNMEDGSLADDIWKEAQDATINPEILWDAKVRVSNDLCVEEKAFREKRKEQVVIGLAKYLHLEEKDIHPDDVPVIAMCGSGGGLRALVAGTSSYLSAQEAGLWDCVTYTAGVSGSCWLQTLYNSSLGEQDFEKIIHHLKGRIGTHIAFPPAAMKLATIAPTNKFLLSGFVEKLKGNPGADFGLVDIYGLLLAARLLVPRGELDVNARDLKISNQSYFLQHGQHPMPIYTAVRHEIPIEDVKKEAEKSSDEEVRPESIKEQAKKEAWFQWFEFTPYEVFCEEFGAGIPTYALGRPFANGRNKVLDNHLALPEIRIPLMMGIWGSAFCATLAHYYKEIKPLASGLYGFGQLDSLLAEKNSDLIKIHPIDPSSIPNYVYGMEGQLPESCPESVFQTDQLQFMDAGMSNNLPIYPLLRPGRDVDILVAFDASADIKQENWLSVVDGYARQRSIKGWPLGLGWPKASNKPEETVQQLEEAENSSGQEAAVKIAEAREARRKHDNETEKVTDSKNKLDLDENDLGYCTVWVGMTEERIADKVPTFSKRLFQEDEPKSEFALMEPNAGLRRRLFPIPTKCEGRWSRS